MRGLLVVALLVACRPAPVLNPDKEKAALRGQPVVRGETEMTTAPGGTVTGIDGAPFDLSTLWASSPVVVVFYKGHWCPPCQKQLAELESRRPELVGAGVSVVAISTDEPADLKDLRSKLNLGFPLYSDSHLNVIQTWGVEDYGNGIAKPATFIIAKGGGIAYRKIGRSETDRPSAQDILDALADLK